jgi:hypothetical protein
MQVEISEIVTKVTILEDVKLKLENEIVSLENEKVVLEKKLNSIHLEETAFSNIFEEQHELNTNNDETSLYQGLDYTLMDSMNISCDLNPTILGSPRGSEYVRAAEETTRSLLNELDELKKTKQTLERSIRDIRVKLTPKKSPRKTLSLSPNPNKFLSLTPKKETDIKLLNISLNLNAISPKRKALSPIPINANKVDKNTIKSNNKGVRRKSISIDLNENIENINPNEITFMNNNIDQKNNNNNNGDIINENENRTALCITKIKPTTFVKKAVIKKARLKVSKINISNLFE